MGLQENCTQYSRVVKTNPETSIGSQLLPRFLILDSFCFPSILSISSFLRIYLPTSSISNLIRFVFYGVTLR